MGANLLTFGADVEIRSETEWAGGDVGGNPQGEVSLDFFSE